MLPRVFAVSFMHLELRREDYRKVGGSKAGIGLQLVNKIICSLEHGYTSKGSEKEVFQKFPWHSSGLCTHHRL